MPRVKLEKLAVGGLSWCPFQSGKVHQLAAGEHIPAVASDAPQYFIIVSGRVLFYEQEESTEVHPGELICIWPGTPFGIPKALEESTVVQLGGRLNPPFREASYTPGSKPPVVLPPIQALIRPERFGVSVSIDAAKTYSPGNLGEGKSAGLLVEMDVRSTSKNLIQEIRGDCMKHSRQVVGVVLCLKTEDEIIDFSRINDQCGRAFSLFPSHLGIDADLATENGQRLAKYIRKYWTLRLYINGICPMVRMPLRDWAEREAHFFYEELTRLPPGRFAIVLDLQQRLLMSDESLARHLTALDPWVCAIEYERIEDEERLGRILSRIGSQAWLLKKFT